MPTDLEATRRRIAAKQAKVRDAQASRTEAEQKIAEELEAAHLAAEEARLDAELANANEAAKLTNIRAGNSTALDAAKRAMAQYGGDGGVKLPADGSTLEKPKGVNLETGELLSPDQAEKALAAENADEQSQADAAQKKGAR